MPEAEVGFLADYLLGDEQGREAARRIDRQIDRLPGLAGLQLVERATHRPVSVGSAEASTGWFQAA
jgi:hypothetical protein